MQHARFSISVLWCSALLGLSQLFISGCSSALLAAGTTDPKDMIPYGAKRADVIAQFGSSLKSEPVPENETLAHVSQFNRTAIVLRNRTRTVDSSGAIRYEWPQLKFSTLDVYAFEGSIRGKHDTGESTSLALMTFGASELLMVPYAAKSAAARQHYVIKVWYDDNDVVIAYAYEPVVTKQK